jgi:pimeloyl-ACP methyl ester carboxylesterase
MRKLTMVVLVAGVTLVAQAEVWYVPGWNRTAETNGLAYTSCTNVFAGAKCRFWGWDGDRGWTTSMANADAAARRLADEIAATNAAFRSELVLVGHSLGGRIVGRALAELSRRGVKVKRGVMLAPAMPMEDPDAKAMGRGSTRPVLLVVNPKDGVLKYGYDVVGGEKSPAIGTNGSPCALENVAEFSVPGTITYETKIAAAWGRSETLKRICNHLAAFYFTELGRILDGRPSKYAQMRVPQGRVNMEWKVMDAGVWWEVLADCREWKLERNVVTGHFRILDPSRVRVAWGSEERMRASFLKVCSQLAASAGAPSGRSEAQAPLR